MSRRQASKSRQGGKVIDELKTRGILIRSPPCAAWPKRRLAPTSDVSRVVDAADHAGLSRKVARLEPLDLCKG